MKWLYIKQIKKPDKYDVINTGDGKYLYFQVLNEKMEVIDHYDYVVLSDGLRIDLEVTKWPEALFRIWSFYGEIDYDRSCHKVILSKETEERIKILPKELVV